MLTPTQRFNFLDNETNVPVSDLSSVYDNTVYNSPDLQSDVSSTISSENISVLKMLQKNINDLSKYKFDPNLIQKYVNEALSYLFGLKLPNMIKDILNNIQSLLPEQLVDFVKDVFGVGKALLCTNLDFLKMFNVSIKINKNILAGLLLAMFRKWLNNICAPDLSKQVKRNYTNRDLIESQIPYRPDLNPDNVFEDFKSSYSDFLKSKEDIGLNPVPNSTDIINSTIDKPLDTIKENMNDLLNCEMTPSEKKAILGDIDNKLNTTDRLSINFTNLLYVRGRVNNMNQLSPMRMIQNKTFKYLNDRIGRLVKSLPDVDLSLAKVFNMSDIDKALHLKMTTLQANLKVNNTLANRSYKTASFNNVNFNNILPTLTPEESNYLKYSYKETNSHRWNDLHPTTLVHI